MHDQMEEMTSPMSITMLDNEMEGEIGRFKMLQENEKLRQEIKELRESQWRRANSENLTSFQRRNQEFADRIQHNTVVRHIKALLLQIRLAIFTSNNVVGRTAISAISTQLSSSDSLAIPLSSLLKARCAFWHGMFLYSNMDYASALECFKLAAGPLSLVARRSSGSPFTPQSEPLAEGVEEAEKVAKMIWKSELEVGRTPARDAPVMLPAPVTPTRPVINVFTREHEPSLSARYWRPSHAISLSDELSLLDNESDSSNDDDEEDHDSDNESVGTCPSMFEQEPQAHFSSCHTRAGSAASMTSISSSDISLAIRRHARQPSKLNL